VLSSGESQTGGILRSAANSGGILCGPKGRAILGFIYFSYIRCVSQRDTRDMPSAVAARAVGPGGITWYTFNCSARRAGPSAERTPVLRILLYGPMGRG
jgi:hypothetical protein